MSNPRYSESIVVASSSQDLSNMVADVTRMGEWSPVCTSLLVGRGMPGRGPGAWFTGRNELPERTWETRSAGRRGRSRP